MAERTRDERIEDYYQQSAWDLAESLVDAEDEATRLRSAWTSARRRASTHAKAWRVAYWRAGMLREEARKDSDVLREMLGVLGIRSDEVRRYRSAWKSAQRRAKLVRRNRSSELRHAYAMWSYALRDLDRYRSAWLSARRRAADEFNHGGEALERKKQEIADLSAELRRCREFAAEVHQIRSKTMVDLETASDLMESHLRPVYGSLYELEAAQRERRPFVPRMEREYGALRESTYGAPQLEYAGTEEDGSTVWRLKDAA
ncbi:hypothetical protein ABT264_19410 [Streptomyces virginiae]|uniref:hypothetical protein n=1 Tax=Streptomyces virginiae TaxID=1961 RepID=UPI0033255A98